MINDYKKHIKNKLGLTTVIALLISLIFMIYYEKGIKNDISKEVALEQIEEVIEKDDHIFSLKINDIVDGRVNYTYLNKESIFKILTIKIIMASIVVCIVAVIIKNIRLLWAKKQYKEISELIKYNEIVSQGKKYIEKNSKEECVLISFDVEKFKIINDVYGYRVGDEVLKSISFNLENYFKNRGVYGRITGDIFVVLTKIKDAQDIKSITSIIKNRIIDIDKKDFNMNIDISIGVYEIKKGDIDVETFIGNADMARLRAKEIGSRDFVLFDEKLREERKKIIQLEKDLFNAINNKEFELYYQPKFNIYNGQVVGSEALIRWMHPTMGTISPGIFIPLAEKTRFINYIGRWVFEEVCKTLEMHQNMGIDVVPVAMNLSRVELYQGDLVERIDEILNKYNINPDLIEIEVTETTALKDLVFINTKLGDIKSLGIKIAMDDFGTGNSNLSGLKDICIDILKLDKSLLDNIEKDAKTQVMVKSILNLSKDLNLTTICEGVENISQIEVLKNINAEIVQGYVYSKPLQEKQYRSVLQNKA